MLNKLLILVAVFAGETQAYKHHFSCRTELSKPAQLRLQDKLRAAGYDVDATQGNLERNRWVRAQNSSQAEWALFLIQAERRIHLDIDAESTPRDILDDVRIKLRLSRQSTKRDILSALGSKKTAVLIYHPPDSNLKLGENPMKFILEEIKPYAYLIFHTPAPL